MGISLLFVSSFTIRCSSLGTCTLNKCKFEFNNFNSGNISNIQQVYAFFLRISCVLYQTTLFFILEMARTWLLVADVIKKMKFFIFCRPCVI
jgi:hypothetical protein